MQRVFQSKRRRKHSGWNNTDPWVQSQLMTPGSRNLNKNREPHACTASSTGSEADIQKSYRWLNKAGVKNNTEVLITAARDKLQVQKHFQFCPFRHHPTTKTKSYVLSLVTPAGDVSGSESGKHICGIPVKYTTSSITALCRVTRLKL